MECDDLEEFGIKHDDNDREYGDLYKFVRIGEEMDDSEQRGYGFENIYISRAIAY